jgi:TctA family transporter
MSAIHRSFYSTSATVRTLIALLFTAVSRSGAKAAMDRPSIQLSRQNQLSVPEPTTTDVEAWNIACSILSS